MFKSVSLCRIISTLCALVFCGEILYAQTASNNSIKITISGYVVDSTTQKGVEYATVAIIDNNNTPIAAVATDGNGKFTIDLKKKGDFNITAGSVGYADMTQKLDIDWTKSNVDIGSLYLKAGIEIKEIVVASQRPLIKAEPDKMVYSVEADPEAQTSTLLDILRKVPQLSVDGEDNVLLNGQSNYKVLVDGKSSNMYNNNFKEIVRSMPANAIKDVEVITNPSTKYEAEGVGGIINIITNKKQRIQGYNGNINGGAGAFDSYNGGVYFATQQGKLNLSIRYNYGKYGHSQSFSESTGINYTSESNRYSESFSRNLGGTSSRSHSYSLSGSYDIDSLNLITLELWGYNGRYNGGSESESRQFDIDKNMVLEYFSNYNNSSKWSGLSGSLDYQKLFKKPDRTLTFSYKLDNDPSYDNYTTDINGINYPSYNQRSRNDAFGREHTFQVDFYEPINKHHNIEAGIKHIIRQNNSDTEIERINTETGEWEEYRDNMNDMNYTQNIFGAYGGYQYKLDKFSAKAGFRLEGTWNNGVAKTIDGNIDIKNKFLNLIPYVNFAYTMDQSKSFSLSYTQRIQRPGIWFLNPYVDDENPLNISYGNPNLKSSIMNSFALGYRQFSQKISFTVSLNGAVSNNSISGITTVRPDGVTENTCGNIGIFRQFGGNVYFTYSLSDRFRIYTNIMSYYVKSGHPVSGVYNDGGNFSASLGGNVKMWKGSRFMFNGYYSSGNINIYGRSPEYYYYAFGINQEFYKRKFSISLNISNPFNYYRTQESTSASDTFEMVNKYRYVQRRWYVGVNYRFGKTETQVKKTRRTINNDDLMSGDGGGNSGGE